MRNVAPYVLGEQTFEGRQESLNQANKLSRTHAALVEALDLSRSRPATQCPQSILSLISPKAVG
jgi:hypothetical protein